MLTTRQQLLETARAYQSSALLIALAQLGICDALEKYSDGASAEDLAAISGLQTRPLAALLVAAAGLGLVEVRNGDRYANTALGRACLVKGSRGNVLETLNGEADFYTGWGRLAEAVREGRQILPNLQSDESDPQALRRLLVSLDVGGRNFEPGIQAILAPRLAKAGRLLDIGAGLGTFGREWAEAYPQLQATLFDQTAVIKLAQEFSSTSPAYERLEFWAGDYKTTDFGRNEYDLVLLFRVLRTESPFTNNQILRSVARALKSGGAVVVLDSLLNDDRTGPAANVLRHLTMTLTYAEGGLVSPTELTGWMNEAGLSSPTFEEVPTAPGMTLVISCKEESSF